MYQPMVASQQHGQHVMYLQAQLSGRGQNDRVRALPPAQPRLLSLQMNMFSLTAVQPNDQFTIYTVHSMNFTAAPSSLLQVPCSHTRLRCNLCMCTPVCYTSDKAAS